MKISGAASPAGTQKYRQRHQHDCAAGHFRSVNDLVFSSLGIGTYLGQPDAPTDSRVTNAIIESVRVGINLIDTAINYRYMHAERSVKQALAYLLEREIVAREELIICTKGGFIPHPDRMKWFTAEYVRNSNFNISERDCAAQCHCLHPEYLSDQLNRSLENLGLDTIDIYYIHNPETQLAEVSAAVFYQRLSDAFAVMEKAVREGKIKAYGLATWSGLRVPPTASNHINLSDAKTLAATVAGASRDNFKYIQLPVNAAMREALVEPTQLIGEELVSAIDAAQSLGINVLASASLAQTQAFGQIPDALISTFSQIKLTPAQQALQFTRSCPGVLAALVGMKNPAHIASNLALNGIEPLKFQL